MKDEPAGPGRACCRRQFLAGASAGTAGLLLGSELDAIAGPFTPQDRGALVPRDKKLSPEWIRSLTARGAPEWLTGDELRYVGMPVGGICCGQLYLAGDGRLWHWDVFRSNYGRTDPDMAHGKYYTTPREPDSRVEQGFAVRVGETTRRLDRSGIKDVRFRGEYPIGRIRYRDDALPVQVELEAFSPFVPLDAEDSGLPLTVMSFSVENTSDREVEVEIAGWLQNAVCPYDDQPGQGRRRNHLRRSGDATMILSTAEQVAGEPGDVRPEIVFEGFEGRLLAGWKREGDAFGSRPLRQRDLPEYQDVTGYHGKGFVNSHRSNAEGDIEAADRATGKLVSREFRIRRRFVNFHIGGGKHPGRTELRLVCGGKVVRRATGHDSNHMRLEQFAVADLQGEVAHLEIVDAATGRWGNIGIDQIVFADQGVHSGPLEDLHGFGSMALSVLDDTQVRAAVDVGPVADVNQVFARLGAAGENPTATRPFGDKLVGALAQRRKIAPGTKSDFVFLVSWYFPFYRQVAGAFAPLQNIDSLARHYHARFGSAAAVSDYVARRYEHLAGTTRLWNRTWYDSTLPYWFLDRTFVTLDCLATQTCHWFDNGRFWGWEGVDCCAGTCQHVWQYAQGLARIFPQLERGLREEVDYGIAFHQDGALDYRAENARHVAHDGLCGTLLRAYREHSTAADDRFLRRNWWKIKRSIAFMMREDGDADGLLEGRQYNTLDAAWYGPMGWLSSLYLAALEAGRRMASEAGDAPFARRCTRILEVGRKNIVTELFDGDYFVHKPDPNFPEATNTNKGCHIDQVFGQSYAWQLGLDRVVPAKEARSALRALWRYNFAPDIGPYREKIQKVIPRGRWYALPGEGGLLMCTWPKGGADRAAGKGNRTFVGYFNECMTGFEYQVAAHMVFEGLVREGLAITRMIHDRYGAKKRNPYNEIECSDHYARAMMSYGVFLAACGFDYHGPSGHLGLAPRIGPKNFRAAFVAAEGWGSYAQTIDGAGLTAALDLRYGRLRLKSLSLSTDAGTKVGQVRVQLAGRELPSSFELRGDRLALKLREAVTFEAGSTLSVRATS